MVEYEFDLAKYAIEYVKNNKDYKLYSFDNSLSVCFNYKDYDPIDLCTKLYDNNKIMVGFGHFKKECFIRLVTINSENTKNEIDLFFKTLEDFTVKFDDKIKKIN